MERGELPGEARLQRWPAARPPRQGIDWACPRPRMRGEARRGEAGRGRHRRRRETELPRAATGSRPGRRAPRAPAAGRTPAPPAAVVGCCGGLLANRHRRASPTTGPKKWA